MNTLNVEYRKVEALIPYARNPRTHAEGQIAKIAAICADFHCFTKRCTLS
ncbi:MAG: hypothetical protein KBD39_03385 [Sterolibacterium sp.]|nr:hypothetical protein [Sterolibacterium sp.]